MKTTAFLTLTGTGAVVYEWLFHVAINAAAAPEFIMLAAAVTGLGLQTLRSERIHLESSEYQPATVAVRAETNA